MSSTSGPLSIAEPARIRRASFIAHAGRSHAEDGRRFLAAGQRVRADIPAVDVLRIATFNGAKYTDRLGSTGVIAPGSAAALILADGDPTTNISDIRHIRLTRKAGVAYLPSEVYAALGVTPFIDPPPMHSVGQR